MVESKSCKECIKELESIADASLKFIIEHRSQCRKCIGCYRLDKAKKSYERALSNKSMTN